MIFGIGTDIIEVDRIRKELAKNSGLKEKIFTASEISYCESKHDRAQHFAARFAAKEAFFKALGIGWRDGLEFQNIEIRNDKLGKPQIIIIGKVKEFFETNKLKSIQLSMGHIKELAIAFVIIEK